MRQNVREIVCETECLERDNLSLSSCRMSSSLCSSASLRSNCKDRVFSTSSLFFRDAADP